MRRLFFLSLLLALPGLSGCGLLWDRAGQAAVPAAAPRADLLAPGDLVRVTVAGEQELSGTFAVGQGGSVHLELVGDVRAAGLTPPMLADDLRRRLAAGYLKNPAVTVARAGPGAPAVSPPPPLQGSVSDDPGLETAGKAKTPGPAPALRRSQDVGGPY